MTDQPRPHSALGSEPIRTIGREELRAKIDHGEPIKLIMALNRWAYDAKHIPGSLHFDSPNELYASVKSDDEIIVYCSSVDCLASVALYRDLVSRDYKNDWKDLRKCCGDGVRGLFEISNEACSRASSPRRHRVR
jgi:rhodanese-related sulfurtransferase